MNDRGSKVDPTSTAVRRRALLAWAGAAAVVPFQGCLETFRGEESEAQAVIVLNNLTREQIGGELTVLGTDESVLHEEAFYIERKNHHQTARFPEAATIVDYEVVETTADDPHPHEGVVRIPDEPADHVPDREVRRITLDYTNEEIVTYREF